MSCTDGVTQNVEQQKRNNLIFFHDCIHKNEEEEEEEEWFAQRGFLLCIKLSHEGCALLFAAEPYLGLTFSCQCNLSDHTKL